MFCRFAYIEFVEKEGVELAMALDESLFRGRQIKVCLLFAEQYLIKFRMKYEGCPKSFRPNI